MTNLDRLKDTDLLIQGFDEFLAGWLGVEPNLEPIDWDSPRWAFARLLPRHVRMYYDLVQKWPSARMKKLESKHEQLDFPPRHSIHRAAEKPGQELISILAGQRRIWEICVLNSPEENYPVTHGDYESRSIQDMQTPLDELLVTHGFNCLIANTTYCDVRRKRTLFSEATLLFTGRYQLDSPRHVLYHPEGYLWFGWQAYDPNLKNSDSSTHWCAKKPRS